MSCEVCAYAQVNGCWPPGPLMALRQVHCPTCHATWSKAQQSCHCARCHQTLPSLRAFDRHLVAERRAG